MKRPQLNDAAIVSAALAPYAKVFEVDKDTDQKGWDLLVKVFQDSYLHSRFEIAKELESAGWDIDDNMLDAIESVDGKQHQEHHRAVKAWVQANAITPKLAVDAKVSVTRRGQTHLGTIAKIHDDTAQYVVAIPDLGHVKTGLGTHGWVIPFEELHALAAEPEDFKLQSPASA